MTLTEYINEVNKSLSPPLSGREITWANNARESGIAAKKFAGWLALTSKIKASSPLLPLGYPSPAAEKGTPPPGHESREGDGIMRRLSK